MDIGGIVLVWKFGIPERMEASWKGFNLVLDSDPGTSRQQVFRKAMSIGGAWLILVGFALQIIANWV